MAFEVTRSVQTYLLCKSRCDEPQHQVHIFRDQSQRLDYRPCSDTVGQTICSNNLQTFPSDKVPCSENAQRLVATTINCGSSSSSSQS